MATARSLSVGLNKKDPIAENLQEICKAANRPRPDSQLLASAEQILDPRCWIKQGDPGDGEDASSMIGEDIELLIHWNGLGRIKADPDRWSRLSSTWPVKCKDAMPREES